MNRVTAWWRKRRIAKSLKILVNFDDMMARAGIQRQERRAFWRTCSQDPAIRERVCKEIATRINEKIEGK